MDSGQPVIRLGSGGAYVQILLVRRPIRTNDSPRVTAAAIPSTTGTPRRAERGFVQPGHPAAAQAEHLGVILLHR